MVNHFINNPTQQKIHVDEQKNYCNTLMLITILEMWTSSDSNCNKMKYIFNFLEFANKLGTSQAAKERKIKLYGSKDNHLNVTMSYHLRIIC